MVVPLNGLCPLHDIPSYDTAEDDPGRGPDKTPKGSSDEKACFQEKRENDRGGEAPPDGEDANSQDQRRAEANFRRFDEYWTRLLGPAYSLRKVGS